MKRLKKLLRPPRRLRFTRAGWLFTIGALAIGVAAIPTGNNLLFLLLGAMLGFIAVSGWLSEQTLRGLRIERRVPRGVTAGQPGRLSYVITNGKRRIPSYAVTIRERELRPRAQPGAHAWIAGVAGRATVTVRAAPVLERRGVYPLREITLSTGFPFGLFEKERDLPLPGELVVWPRADLIVREPRGSGANRPTHGAMLAAGPVGARGEFRGLREYRSGDDPRDVHWRTSARTRVPVVREYERDTGDVLWLCVDARATADADAQNQSERVLEAAASIAALATERGRPVGMVLPHAMVQPGSGPGQLESILDALARVQLPTEISPPPPLGAATAVLVTSAGDDAGAWSDVFTPADAREPA